MAQIPADRRSDVPQTTHDELADNAVLVDVREPDEWALGHAPQAIHIPLADLPGRLGELPKDRPVVVTCRGGGRASRAVAFLREQGYDAVSLAGGMLAWKDGNRPMQHDGDGTPDVV